MSKGIPELFSRLAVASANDPEEILDVQVRKWVFAPPKQANDRRLHLGGRPEGPRRNVIHDLRRAVVLHTDCQQAHLGGARRDSFGDFPLHREDQKTGRSRQLKKLADHSSRNVIGQIGNNFEVRTGIRLRGGGARKVTIAAPHRVTDLHRKNIPLQHRHMRLRGETRFQPGDQPLIQLNRNHASCLSGNKAGESAVPSTDLKDDIFASQVGSGNNARSMGWIYEEVLAEAPLGAKDSHSSCSLRMVMKASWGISTDPIIFMRFFPAFCFSSSLRFRVMSPP
jgi:hypothetical protein